MSTHMGGGLGWGGRWNGVLGYIPGQVFREEQRREKEAHYHFSFCLCWLFEAIKVTCAYCDKWNQYKDMKTENCPLAHSFHSDPLVPQPTWSRHMYKGCAIYFYWNRTVAHYTLQLAVFTLWYSISLPTGGKIQVYLFSIFYVLRYSLA